MKVAIYARKSTEEQAELNQVGVLEKWAGDRGWEVQGIYTDVGSGWVEKGDQYREQFQKLMQDCQHGVVRAVLVYDLSRLTRRGPEEMLRILRQFGENGAEVYSYCETWLNGPSEFRPLLISCFGYFAELFSRQLSARTKAGMERARAQGKHIGRPRKEKRDG